MLKIYASGSGLGMLSMPETVSEIITLSKKETPNVLYIGTATYDVKMPMAQQTKAFVDKGCKVTSLNVTIESPSQDTMRAALDGIDIVLVSGGNTLFAVDRWVKTGLDVLLKEAAANGVVMSGGSAGAIVWFEGGHSDSMEPGSFKNPPGPMLLNTKEALENWAYMRVPGIGLLNGLFCPHYDMTGSNGVARYIDYTEMLRRHSGEYGLGFDNWSALMIDGDKYTVISRAGKQGSVGENGEFVDERRGRPGAWKMTIATNGELQRTLIPATGNLKDIITKPNYITQSNMLDVVRKMNPDDGVAPSWHEVEMFYQMKNE